MAKYEVTAPLSYSRPTGVPTGRRGVRGEEVVYCEPGDIIELDDAAAHILSRKLQPFVEPVRTQRKKPNHRPAPLTVTTEFAGNMGQPADEPADISDQDDASGS